MFLELQTAAKSQEYQPTNLLKSLGYLDTQKTPLLEGNFFSKIIKIFDEIKQLLKLP